jgi:rhodanese-related sulfurtransferase
MEEETTQAEEGGAERTDGETVSPEQARQMIGSNEATAIDIRDDEKWREGHVPAARHCPEGELEQALERIDDDQTVIVACEDGEESAKVAAEIREQGREAVIIAGGMEAWRSDDMPMQPSRDVEDDTAI